MGAPQLRQNTNGGTNIGRPGVPQNTNGGLNIGRQDAKWIDIYYNDYVRTANAVGISPLGKNEFYQTYGGSGEINFENVRTAYESELFPKIKEAINTTSQQIANVTGGDYTPYRGAADRDSLLNELSNVKSTYTFEENRAYNKYVTDTKAAGGTPVERAQWNPSMTGSGLPKYEFKMPSEWQTIEDMANETVKKGEPTLDPDLVNQWEGKLETSYAPVREKLKSNMANYWASLFPQGGGSGKQAEANMGQLTDFETNKFERALGFAQSDLAQKLAAFALAQQKLGDIGGFKASADQFKSQFDASQLWNQINQNWNKTQAENTRMQSDRQWQRESDLAKYLAEISRPQQPDFGTQLLGGIVGGLGTAGGYTGMAKLLSLIPGLK